MTAPEFPDALVARAAEALEAKFGYGARDGELLARAVLLAVGPELQAEALREAAEDYERMWQQPGSATGADWLRRRADRLAPAPANAQEAGR